MELLSKIKDLLDEQEMFIFRGTMPEATPNECVSISMIPGRPADLDLDGVSMRNPSFRVVVRDTDYDTCESRLEAIITILTATHTSSILAIYIESDMVDLGKDNKNRSSIYCNFQVKTV
jgi:hypothetical protein